jgi:biopolymer transport protein ExbD
MRIRSRLTDRVPIDMTPMIDIVFQLLIFFVLTLRIAQPEGDFDMQMPPGRTADAATSEFPPLIVVLKCDEEGGLEGVSLNSEPLGSLDQLHLRVSRLVADNPQLTAEGRVELRCDGDLAYEHTIAALGAVSATRHPDGSLTRLIERVNLLNPEP